MDQWLQIAPAWIYDLPSGLRTLLYQLYQTFIAADRWKWFANGLKITFTVTIGALILGVIIGMVIAVIRTAHDSRRAGKGSIILNILNAVCKLYLTVIRGTPVVVQLMITYYIIFASSRNGVGVATLAFGINSGAYVAEIFRSGIMSIDPGQFEAGRSLGFNYVQTMRYIIIPQAFKNVLPTLANEFISLLKETSVAGYVTVRDLTMGGNIIRAATYSPFLPLFAVALIYLALVMFFTFMVGKLERKLRNSER